MLILWALKHSMEKTTASIGSVSSLNSPQYLFLDCFHMTGCTCVLKIMGKTWFHSGKVHVKGWMKARRCTRSCIMSDHLSACPLTVHALLHIPNDIQNNGPPCMNWMFVMEHWCGLLLPAIKSWKKPFICLAFRQYQAAQYLEITNQYNLLDFMPTIINDNLPLQHES